jgi:hypothetical protein
LIMSGRQRAVCLLLTLGALNVPPLYSQTTANSRPFPSAVLDSTATGWHLRDATVVSSGAPNAEYTVKLAGVIPEPGKWSHIGTDVRKPPVEHAINFSCLLKGTADAQKLSVNAFAYDESNKFIEDWVIPVAVNQKDWKQFHTTYVLPKNTERFTVWVVDTESSAAFFSQPKFVVGGPQKASIGNRSADEGRVARAPDTSSTVLYAHYKACVQAEKSGQSGTVTFPIPGLYREQFPLTFEISTEPPSASSGYRIYKRSDGRNWLCELKVKPPDKGVIISWNALVLVNGRKVQILPKVAPDAPKNVSEWLRSTKCVQTNSPEIEAKVKDLAAGAISDVEDYVRKVIAFTSRNQGTGAKFVSLDAKSALSCGGSCTSRANLAAALLRAKGIPARTLAHLPVWAPRLFEHWLVEYWHPTVGWVWVESTSGQYQPAPNRLVVLAESSADDEDKADDPIHLRYIMPGAAYLSGCELSNSLLPSALLPNAEGPNNATFEATIGGDSAELKSLYELGRMRFDSIVSQTGKSDLPQSRIELIRQAAKSGRASALLQALR